MERETPDGAVVPKIAANLADDHGHTVGGEFYRLGDIEVVNGLDEPHTAHLKKIVHALAPICKALNHRQHQPQIAFNEGFAGLLVPGFAAAEQLCRFAAFQHPQLCRIDTCDLHLSLHLETPPAVQSQQKQYCRSRFFLYGSRLLFLQTWDSPFPA